MELVNGALRVAFDNRHAPTSATFNNSMFNDGSFHRLRLQIASELTVSLDGVSRIIPSAPNGVLNVATGYFLGGLQNYTALAASHLESHTSLLGCIANFSVNGQLASLQSLASGSSRPTASGCVRSTGCTPSPCQQGGECVDEWSSTSCSCPSGTSGQYCQVVESVSFNGKHRDMQISSVQMRKEKKYFFGLFAQCHIHFKYRSYDIV